MALLSVRVAARRDEAVGICSFELVSADGSSLPAFTSGAHIDVHLPNGIVRQYSLWNRPGEPSRYCIGVLREQDGRGGSRAMHELVHEGSTLQISAPRNHFPLKDGPQQSLLLAGGIGITPILSMVRELAERGDSFEFHYCTRSRDRAAFLDELLEVKPADSIHVHFDDGDLEQRLDLRQVLSASASDCHVYVCGPKGFIEAVLGCARSLGWDEGRLHYESFAPITVSAEQEAAFSIEIASTGRRILVRADQTAVEALHAAGIAVETSCEQGICGTCLTRVLSGTPDHRDSFLMPEEHARNDCFTPCCSRSLSPLLVLDL